MLQLKLLWKTILRRQILNNYRQRQVPIVHGLVQRSQCVDETMVSVDRAMDAMVPLLV